MHARLPRSEFDGDIAGGAGGLFHATQREITDVSRQTVGGEVAVSTVEHDGNADAVLHGQVRIEFGKGHCRTEIKVVAVEWFHATC